MDSTGAVGVEAALAFDASDNPWIAYYDESNGDLKVATAKSGTWTILTVDSVGDVGLAPSIVVSGGYVYISYYDADKGVLKYAVGH